LIHRDALGFAFSAECGSDHRCCCRRQRNAVLDISTAHTSALEHRQDQLSRSRIEDFEQFTAPRDVVVRRDDIGIDSPQDMRLGLFDGPTPQPRSLCELLCTKFTACGDERFTQ